MKKRFAKKRKTKLKCGVIADSGSPVGLLELVHRDCELCAEVEVAGAVVVPRVGITVGVGAGDEGRAGIVGDVGLLRLADDLAVKVPGTKVLML